MRSDGHVHNRNRISTPEAQSPPSTTHRRPQKLSDLSPPRKVLLRTCQDLGHGQILDLHVVDHEPTFHPPPTLLWDIRLDADDAARPESELPDFALRAEVVRLLEALDTVKNGRIQRIEVRAGIPRRVLVEAKLTEAER